MFSYSKAMRKKIKDPINHMTILFFSIGSIRVLNFHAKFRMYYHMVSMHVFGPTALYPSTLMLTAYLHSPFHLGILLHY